MTKKPCIWVIAGHNGAGKSTLINHIKDLIKIPPFINPDVIACALDPINQNSPPIIAQAGRIAIGLRKKYIAQKKSFGIETTLSGNSTIKMILEAIKQGYQVNLVFVGLDSVKTSLFRVALRVKEGGHNVPQEAILRRYKQCLSNLNKVSHYTNKLYIFDNSNIKHNLLLNVNKNKIMYLAPNLPK